MGDEADVTGSTQGSSDPRGRAGLSLPGGCWDQPYGRPSSPPRSRARELCEIEFGQLEINKENRTRSFVIITLNLISHRRGQCCVPFLTPQVIKRPVLPPPPGPYLDPRCKLHNHKQEAYCASFLCKNAAPKQETSLIYLSPPP
jgi:hypothetical protein